MSILLCPGGFPCRWSCLPFRGRRPRPFRDGESSLSNRVTDGTDSQAYLRGDGWRVRAHVRILWIPGLPTSTASCGHECDFGAGDAGVRSPCSVVSLDRFCRSSWFIRTTGLDDAPIGG